MNDSKNQDNLITRSPLEEILKEGAQKMLMHALKAEIDEYIKKHSSSKDNDGKNIVVKNGYAKERTLLTGIGKMKVKAPRVHDRRKGKRFTSVILPAYLRKTKSLDELIPFLYLKGISTGNMQDSLVALLGDNYSGFSPTTVVRLKEKWEQEYSDWNKRDLSNKNYVYIWADGVYMNVRLDGNKTCLLVIVGATESGKKEILGIHSGYRESKTSWKELLCHLKDQGLTVPPKIAIADGALGFWGALQEEFPETKEQRCWVHKTKNVLDKAPQKIQPEMKRNIFNIYRSDTKGDCCKSQHVLTYREDFQKN